MRITVLQDITVQGANPMILGALHLILQASCCLSELVESVFDLRS